MEGGREEVRDARRRGLPPVPPPRRRPAALLLRRRRRDDAGSGDGDGAHVRAGEQARAWARGAALRRRLRPRAGARHARPPHLLLHLRTFLAPPSPPNRFRFALSSIQIALVRFVQSEREKNMFSNPQIDSSCSLFN